MARYLVTGGAGFIGSNLTEALLGGGHDVRVLDNFSTGRRENLSEAEAWASAGGGRYELLEGDVRSMETCRDAVRERDFALHEAAIPSVPRSVADPQSSNEVNVTGTLNLLVAARDAELRRFVFASSSSIYGESETLPKIESMPPAPISPYGLQKLTAETYCSLFYRLYGLPTIALRYFNVFGPRQDPKSDYAAVVPRFVTAVLHGGTPTIFGDGEQSRDFTFVANVVQANLRACEAAEPAFGGTYNIGCGQRITLNDLLGEIGRLAERPADPTYADPRPGDIRHSLASIDAAGKLLGFTPEVALVEGLRHTIKAY